MTCAQHAIEAAILAVDRRTSREDFVGQRSVVANCREIGIDPSDVYDMAMQVRYGMNYVPVEKHPDKATWVMWLDDFDDDVGERPLPHCGSCGRGVYYHDQGNFCPWCGSPMTNPI